MMNEDEIERLADLLFDRIMEKQEEADREYAQQIMKLAKMQTIMMILEEREEYEKAAVIQKKIKNINKKLNNGSGKY